MLRIGLTGGICCGKSTALEIFGQLGFDAINLDRYVHEALNGNSSIQQGLIQHFGKEAIDPLSGKVNTDHVAKLAFSNRDLLTQLEQLIYPTIETLWKTAPQRPTVIEVPLLFEKNMREWFDLTVCIYASYETQLQRAILSRKWTKAHFDARASAQMSLEKKMELSDFVIGNNGNKIQLERQIQLLIEKLDAFVKERTL